VILVGVTDAGALAAIDCGTNSTRLLVVGSAGDVRAREMTITRLGEGVDATRRLSPEAMERTFAALRAYRSIMDAERVGRARLVATSAVRDAANGEAFLLPAAEIIGAPAELLPGIEEGRLSYAGATSDLPVTDAAAVVLDIGGGSTEMVTKAEEEILSVSLDIGCVRLTERFLRGDIAGGCENDVGFNAIIIAGPFPYADALGAVLDGFVHAEILEMQLFVANDYVHVILAAKAMIGDGEKGIDVRRHVNPRYGRAFVHHHIQESGILVRESVVILPPHRGRDEDVQ